MIVAGVLAGVFGSSGSHTSAFYSADPFALGIGVLWCLWLKWSDLRKKWKGSSDGEEHESLSDGSETDFDYEKGIVKGRKNKSKKNRDNSDFVVRSPETGS